MKEIEKYFNETDNMIVFAEYDGSGITCHCLKGSTKIIIAMLMELTTEALKKSHFDIYTYCKILKEGYEKKMNGEFYAKP